MSTCGYGYEESLHGRVSECDHHSSRFLVNQRAVAGDRRWIDPGIELLQLKLNIECFDIS